MTDDIYVTYDWTGFCSFGRPLSCKDFPKMSKSSSADFGPVVVFTVGWDCAGWSF